MIERTKSGATSTRDPSPLDLPLCIDLPLCLGNRDRSRGPAADPSCNKENCV